MKSSPINLSSASSTSTTLHPKLQESDVIYSSQEDCMVQDNDLTTDNDGTPKSKRQSCFANIGTSAIELKKMYFKDDDSNEDNDKSVLNEVKTRPVVEKSPEGRFHRFDEELGIGAQKKVYLGYDYDNGREVAWNAIDVSFVEESTILKIRDEIEMLKKLRHPNIISFVFCFYNELKKEIVIITELFSGGSLKHYLKAYKKPRLRVIKLWCQDILTGLEYLHKLPSPIIHRDIKCDNILVNKNTGKVKIGDLGSSCTLKKCGYCKSFNGTAEFCSPEVYIGKYGVKADIYSFGMCLLEMVTNERPYAECEGNVLLICEKATKQVLPLCISKIKNIRLYNFIVNCLKPEQERPYASDLLRSDFLTDLNGEENDYPALEYPIEEVSSTSASNGSKNSRCECANNHNSKLNIIATSAYDGYVNIYKDINLKLMRSVYVGEEFYVDMVIVVSSPLPGFIIYNSERKIVRVFGLNTFKHIKEVHIEGGIVCYKIVKDFSFCEHMVVGNEKGEVVMVKLPFIEEVWRKTVFECNEIVEWIDVYEDSKMAVAAGQHGKIVVMGDKEIGWNE